MESLSIFSFLYNCLYGNLKLIINLSLITWIIKAFLNWPDYLYYFFIKLSGIYSKETKSISYVKCSLSINILCNHWNRSICTSNTTICLWATDSDHLFQCYPLSQILNIRFKIYDLAFVNLVLQFNYVTSQKHSSNN